MSDSLVFLKCGARETKKLVKLINPVFEDHEFDGDNTVIMAAGLSFYEYYRLLEIIDHSVYPNVKRRVVQHIENNEIIKIDYSKPCIDSINKTADIFLTKRNVADYVRFYFDNISGPHGKFYVVESVDDIPWIEDPTPPERKAMHSLIRETVCKNKDKNNNFIVETSFLFKSALFDAMVTVSIDGEVNILSRDMLKEDIPAHDFAIGH